METPLNEIILTHYDGIAGQSCIRRGHERVAKGKLDPAVPFKTREWRHCV
jgi:hypothetical protein